MALFVHITLEKHAKSIQRSGIKAERWGLYAMPVVPNFYLTHQWVRELRRFGHGPMVAVYFRVEDDLEVLAGGFNQTHQTMTTSEAMRKLLTDQPLGFEVILPRAVPPKAIHRIRRLYQGIGWRYWPESHGRTPCGCPYCQRGLYGSQKLRKKYENDLG